MRTILIIEDEKFLSNLQARFLKSEGFNVLIADDGNKGIALFKENKVDLVITDIIMPEKEGLETIIELKKLLPDIPIIAISGGGRCSPECYLDSAKKLGAKYIFEKPFNQKDLLSSIKKALGDEV